VEGCGKHVAGFLHDRRSARPDQEGLPRWCRIEAPAFVGRWGGQLGLAQHGEETTMAEYLIMFNDEWVPPHTLEQLREKSTSSMKVIEDMQEAGVFVYAEGGIDASTAVCSVEAKDGEPIFTDGPYAETKEHLGGFTVVDVPDDETARYWAGRLAVALDWPQEVHRFPPRPADRDEHRTGSGEE
jgi:hypothetical protein